MTQRIVLELILFLLPFGLFLVYRAASRDLRIRDRWPLTALAAGGAFLAAAALIITPLLEPSDKGKCFIAARYENGINIPARRMDCEAAAAPDIPASAPTGTPVAPRDATSVVRPFQPPTGSTPMNSNESTPDGYAPGTKPPPEIAPPKQPDDQAQPPQ